MPPRLPDCLAERPGGKGFACFAMVMHAGSFDFGAGVAGMKRLAVVNVCENNSARVNRQGVSLGRDFQCLFFIGSEDRIAIGREERVIVNELVGGTVFHANRFRSEHREARVAPNNWRIDRMIGIRV